MTKVTCVVADDHPAIVAAVSALLEEHGIRVVARARDGAEALAAIEAHGPSLAVLDLRMPRLNGIEVVRRIRTATAVVLYAERAERGLLMDAVDAGARGYVLKESPLDDLVRAARTVAQGGTYVDPVVSGAIAVASTNERLPSLTQRERDVLRLLADGCSNDEVARRLYLSPETVRTHVRKAMRKLDAETRTQAVATALRHSLIA